MEEQINKIKNASNKKEAIMALGYRLNARSYKKLNKLINDFKIDISHYDPKTKHRKYKNITKECPVCGEKFKTLTDSKEKTTCSHSCSNTYYRSGKNNPNFKNGTIKQSSAYRKICFKYHDKKCIICNEVRILEVHHYDKNHENHNPENLIPLCPTHHKYVHSRYKNEILPIINEYIKKFISKSGADG